MHSALHSVALILALLLISDRGLALTNPLLNNPLTRIATNAYSFFYWLPRRNMPYDHPWALFKNNSIEFVRWYQFPHNLPPYRYLDDMGCPDDFFCWGLPGNTLPLGNWDPWGLAQVSSRVVHKYRESELKHGRLAMLGAVGFFSQELTHPLYRGEIGGLALTHMEQLAALRPENSALSSAMGYFGLKADSLGMSPDFAILLMILGAVEVWALLRNWTRWRRDEYQHQFDHNIGIGNLKQGYANGDYGFDPLRLRSPDVNEFRVMQEMELNHGRLAMIAFVGMLGQECLTGDSVVGAALRWAGFLSPLDDLAAAVGVSAGL